MITNVASIVQIVQIVARNNSNTTIAPIQLAQQHNAAPITDRFPAHPGQRYQNDTSSPPRAGSLPSGR